MLGDGSIFYLKHYQALYLVLLVHKLHVIDTVLYPWICTQHVLLAKCHIHSK